MDDTNAHVAAIFVSKSWLFPCIGVCTIYIFIHDSSGGGVMIIDVIVALAFEQT